MRRIVCWTMLFLLFTSMLILAFNVKLVKAQGGTVYINSDGSVSPSSAPISTVDNETYVLTSNIYASIVLQRDNIIVDGNGYTVQGNGSLSALETYDYHGIDITYAKNVTIRNMNIAGFDYGIRFLFSSDDIVYGNNLTGDNCGVEFHDMWGNFAVYGNYIANNIGAGVGVNFCNGGSVYGNRIERNLVGVDLGSSGCTVCGNYIRGNDFGVLASFSYSNYIYNNSMIANRRAGISLFGYSANNIVWENIVEYNAVGVSLQDTSSNTVYHNNFIFNAQEVMLFNSEPNAWDNGYPSGGNYWSDYRVDKFSGPYQNETGSDGIGDTPYVIDNNNTDNFPLMQPGPSVTFACSGVGPDFTGTVVTVDGEGYGLGSLNAAFLASFWRDNGTVHTFAFQSPLIVGPGAEQYVWNSTAGLSTSQSGSIGFDSSGNIAGNYVTVHDVAVTSVAPDRTWVYQGQQVNINLTVNNEGNFTENVTATLYYNITANEVLGTKNVTLAQGQNETIIFVWNTTSVACSYTNYTLSAVVSVPLDYTLADNVVSGGNVTIRILGDINGDGKVDIKDISIAAKAFGSHVGDPRWNPDADFNGDGKVDIRDIALIAKNFGQHSP